MIVVADSGSTRTDWRIISANGTIDQVVTEGINPFHQRTTEIERIIEKSELPRVARKAKAIYFYGAGCNYVDKIAAVRDSIKRFFPQSDIVVNHDLKAAATALCGDSRGIVCILGTGSNSCYYDGNEIFQTTPSLGYVLGDEGSGAYIGKHFIKEILYKKTPESIREKFFNKYNYTKDTILDSVYSKSLANRFLASFAPFFAENIQHPYVHGLLYECFYDFLDAHVLNYKNHDDVATNFTGSIAFYFQDILKKVVNDVGLNFGKVIQRPITDLTYYHQNKSEGLKK